MQHSRVIFMGTPDYAVPALEVLVADERIDLALVVTQPDRPQGRGRRMQSPPVKIAADRLGVPTLQVASLKSPDVRSQLESIGPDLIVVAAFGIILGPRTLSLPRLGCVNLHASLLPAYRGANPIAAAIASGEWETGVTLMQMDRGLDTGPILAIAKVGIAGDDTTVSLTGKLASLGAGLLISSLDELLAGALAGVEQGEGATLTRPMTKDDGWIDWKMSAVEIDRHVRAMTPWPRAWSTLADGTRLQVLAGSVVEEHITAESGTICRKDGQVLVETGDGLLRFDEVLLPGGKPLRGRAIFDRLARVEGQTLGKSGKPDHLQPLIRHVD